MTKSLFYIISFLAIIITTGCKSGEKTDSTPKETISMELTEKDKAVALIESLETGAREPAGYINPEKYIQHNLGVADGLAGFGAVLANPPAGGFKAEVVRSFQDGDYAWDNLTPITPPNASGRTQLDGTTEITDRDKTEENKAIVKGFINDVLLNGKGEKTTDYISTSEYLQHNSSVADGLEGFGAAMKYFAENNLIMEYTKLHMVFGEGNFVLAVSEGKFGTGDHVAYYDLFRLDEGKIVEHWDVIQTIPAKEEWKNANGKF